MSIQITTSVPATSLQNWIIFTEQMAGQVQAAAMTIIQTGNANQSGAMYAAADAAYQSLLVFNQQLTQAYQAAQSGMAYTPLPAAAILPVLPPVSSQSTEQWIINAWEISQPVFSATLYQLTTELPWRQPMAGVVMSLDNLVPMLEQLGSSQQN